MPDTGTGTAVYAANKTAGTQVSSTYEGRHLTFLLSELATVVSGTVVKGEPVVVADGIGDIVGVAFNSSTTAAERIAIDTEGIWNLLVYADDDFGEVAVAVGDALFIDTDDGGCTISKRQDPEQHTPFGYALGAVASGEESIIAVKVHWAPSVDNIWMGIGTPYEVRSWLPRIRIIENCPLADSGHFGDDFQMVLTYAGNNTGSFYGKRGLITIAAAQTRTDGETVGVDGAISILGTLNGGGLGGVRLAGIKGTIVSSGSSDVVTACEYMGAVVGHCMLDTAVVAGMFAAFVAYSAGGAGGAIPHAVLYAYGTYRNGIDLTGWVGTPAGNHTIVLDGNRGYTPNTNDLSGHGALIGVIRVELNDVTGFVPVLAAAP